MDWQSINFPEYVSEVSKNGYADILSFALQAAPKLFGPNLVNTEHKGALPLIAASSEGQAETVRVLLDHGAMVDAMDKTEQTALIAASVKGNTEVIKTLLSYGAKVDLKGKSDEKSALNAASAKGKVESVKILLDHGAEVDSEDINGWPALFVATMYQHTEVVKVLLEGGANPNEQDIMGECPLIRASTFGYVGIVKALLVHGAKIDIQNEEGSTPLLAASLMGRTEIVQILVDNRAPVNMETDSGRTALVSACFSGHTEVVRILMKSGARETKLISLLIAILRDHHDIIQLFIEFGDQVHRSARSVAHCVPKSLLLGIMCQAAPSFPALEAAMKKADVSPQEKIREEVLRVQEVIVEAVNSLQFKMMSGRTRGPPQRSLLLDAGEDTLILPVVLAEFMELNLAADWQSIGALLNLPSVQLRAIRHDNPKAVHCMREMLDLWLKQVNPRPSWDQLVEAVDIVEPVSAVKLRQKYCR